MSPRRNIRTAALVAGERAARAQQFNIGHAVELLLSQAREAGSACAGRKVADARDMERRWLRVEYLTDLIASHTRRLAQGLDTIEGARMVEAGQ